jgi:hypothetical protein
MCKEVKMDLVSSIHAKIELFHYERLRWIEREDLSEVASKLKQEDSSWKDKDLNNGLENLKRYYALSILDPLNFHAVPVPLDPFWHTHLLFSRDYAAFCDKVFGQFIHHQPLLFAETAMVAFVRELYDYTIALQPKIFNNVDRRWWPSLGKATHPICYHMEIVDPIARGHALFPVHKQLRSVL